MAEMNSANLDQRVKRAEDRLAEAEKRAEEERRQLIEEQVELKRQMQDVVSSCNNALVRMQESVNEALKESEERHRQAIEEMERKRRAVEEEMNREREQRAREKEAAIRTAREALKRAEQELEAVCELPCEFFAAGHYAAIQAQMKQAQELFRHEMGQASAALADAAAVDAIVLGEQVRQANMEWEQLFAQYRSRIDGIREERTQFEKEPFGREEQPISEEDRIYWSSGMWEMHAGRVDELTELAQNMNVRDESTNPMKTSQMIQAMAEAGQVGDRQQALMHCIREERKFSDDRYYLAQDLMDPLEDAGFEIFSCGFSQDEPIESYEIILGRFDADTQDILIALSPVRREGVAVRNELVISMIEDVFSQEQIQIYMDAITRVVQGMENGIEIRRVGLDGQAAAAVSANRPNPQRQIQLHERRYH